MRRFLAALALAAALVAGPAGPAAAHVTTNPAAAPPGGEIVLGFVVPDEVTTANVVRVDIFFPIDHPLLGVVVEPLPGWTSAATEVNLNPPVATDDGPVARAVSQTTWTATAGGGTAPGQFQEFHVLVQRLPTDAGQVVFKAVQTYSDGTVVRWIDPVDSAHPSPEHPTPILRLATASAVVPGRPNRATDSDLIGVAGLVAAGLGLVVALVALTRRRVSDGG